MKFPIGNGIVVPSWVVWTILIALISTSGTAIYSSAVVVTKVENIINGMEEMKDDIKDNSNRIYEITKGE